MIPGASPEIPALLKQGLDLFDAGMYFEAHEVLEEFWRDQPEPDRHLTQAIIQIAVGAYHLQRHNYTGAGKLFQRALGHLSELEEDAIYGIDIEALSSQAYTLLMHTRDKHTEYPAPKIPFQRLSD